MSGIHPYNNVPPASGSGKMWGLISPCDQDYSLAGTAALTPQFSACLSLSRAKGGDFVGALSVRWFVTTSGAGLPSRSFFNKAPEPLSSCLQEVIEDHKFASPGESGCHILTTLRFPFREDDR